MKKFVVLVLLLTLLCSCGNEKKNEVQDIHCSTMKEFVSNGSILIDVRSEEEYNAFHLEEAISLPYDTIDSTILNHIPDKETNIIVYCQSGKRSSIAAQTLIDMGYKNVYDLGSIGNCN